MPSLQTLDLSGQILLLRETLEDLPAFNAVIGPQLDRLADVGGTEESLPLLERRRDTGLRSLVRARVYPEANNEEILAISEALRPFAIPATARRRDDGTVEFNIIEVVNDG